MCMCEGACESESESAGMRKSVVCYSKREPMGMGVRRARMSVCGAVHAQTVAGALRIHAAAAMLMRTHRADVKGDQVGRDVAAVDQQEQDDGVPAAGEGNGGGRKEGGVGACMCQGSTSQRGSGAGAEGRYQQEQKRPEAVQGCMGKSPP